MIEFNCLKDGKQNAMVLSFDDGQYDDTVTSLFNKYGLKGTFNLVDELIDMSKIDEMRKIYEGHELAAHGKRHISPVILPAQNLIEEIYENKATVEKIYGRPIVGMAYANGSFDDKTVDMLRSCGIKYARTTKLNPNGKYALPQDFMRWSTTCHINRTNNGVDEIEAFKKAMSGYFSTPRLFFAWSHGHEFVGNFDELEKFCKAAANDDRVWYTTCGEFYEYMTAQSLLLISADSKSVYNPTATRVWFGDSETKEIYSVGPGETWHM